jgi:hypothetical protein
MLRNVVLFIALVLISVTAGRASWVTLGENPLKLFGATYVEFLQTLDKGVAIPNRDHGYWRRAFRCLSPGSSVMLEVRTAHPARSDFSPGSVDSPIRT